jgi:hypothetical protein
MVYAGYTETSINFRHHMPTNSADRENNYLGAKVGPLSLKYFGVPHTIPQDSEPQCSLEGRTIWPVCYNLRNIKSMTVCAVHESGILLKSCSCHDAKSEVDVLLRLV